MKKFFGCFVALLMVAALGVGSALAYGTTTFTENGVKYTVSDSLTTHNGGGNLSATAKCVITPTIRHYSTADIRNGSSGGTVVYSSGRNWATATTTSAYVIGELQDGKNLKAFGWWGH